MGITYSMTGYGKHVAVSGGRQLVVEMRSLNSKGADVTIKLPPALREVEYELREMINEQLVRGKIELMASREAQEAEAAAELNTEVVMAYYHQLAATEKKLGGEGDTSIAHYLPHIIRLPDAIKSGADRATDDEIKVFTTAVEKCIAALKAFRAQEGAKLETALRGSIAQIEQWMSGISPFEQERIERIRQRLTPDGNSLQTFDRDRLEQELIFYLEKLDITEERVRLKAHCEYFLKTLGENEPKGRKLGFIAQEMGREINTLGSKAQHSAMQQCVVMMKDELEKIKEQLLNIL